MCCYCQQSAAYEDFFQSSKHVFCWSWPIRVLYCVSFFYRTAVDISLPSGHTSFCSFQSQSHIIRNDPYSPHSYTAMTEKSYWLCYLLFLVSRNNKYSDIILGTCQLAFITSQNSDNQWAHIWNMIVPLQFIIGEWMNLSCGGTLSQIPCIYFSKDPCLSYI